MVPESGRPSTTTSEQEPEPHRQEREQGRDEGLPLGRLGFLGRGRVARLDLAADLGRIEPRLDDQLDVTSQPTTVTRNVDAIMK